MSENKMSERRLVELSKKNLHGADLTRQVLIGANFGRAHLHTRCNAIFFINFGTEFA